MAKDGSFLPFLTAEGAGRSGNFGTLRTVNGIVAPQVAVPAGANIRLRLVNVDSTRVGDLGVEGANAAVDRDRRQRRSHPSRSKAGGSVRRCGSISRCARRKTAARSRSIDYFAAEPVTLATLVAQGASSGDRNAFRARHRCARPNSRNPISPTREPINFSSPQSAAATDYTILAPHRASRRSRDRSSWIRSVRTHRARFWAIDGKTWPQTGHEHLPPPLMSFARGDSVRIELLNTTPHLHPMHLHGHTFKVLSSSKLQAAGALGRHGAGDARRARRRSLSSPTIPAIG